MRFRLVYQGELKSNQRDPLSKQPDRLAEHKQAIRKIFHRQLKHLWETNWFLSTHQIYPDEFGMNRSAADNIARWGSSRNQMVPLRDAVSQKYREYGYHFVPLVQEDWRLMCSLDILFLRHDPPGSVIHAGDLDNRVKTLIDALRKPGNATELRGNETPAVGEEPFFCLLEDDKLVTGLVVESDRFLVPPNGKSDEDRRQVHIVITVDVRPYDVTTFNLSFA